MKLAISCCFLTVACSGGTHPESSKVTLNASGATFQKTAQEVTIEAFAKAHPGVTVNYGGGGSGKGRQDFADQVVDFACTDTPYKPDDAKKVKGGEFFYIPNLLGAISVTYNLPGITVLQLSSETLAKIFQREITQWNDPAIIADNPAISLPAIKIVVVRRSDGSGTTENFSRYLDKAAGGVWKLKSGSTVEWPADTQAGNGNGGVAQVVKSTRGAIGYVDLSDAKGSRLAIAAVKNSSGKYVLPDAASVTAAAAGIEVQDDLLFSALDAKGELAYPITAQSWCLAYANQRSKTKGAAVKAYFKFMLTEGQALLAEVDYGRIPRSLQERALAQVERIRVP